VAKSTTRPGIQKFVNTVYFAVPKTKFNSYSLTSNYLYLTTEETEAFRDRVKILLFGMDGKQFQGWLYH
jgi:hypothetical protein